MKAKLTIVILLLLLTSISKSQDFDHPPFAPLLGGTRAFSMGGVFTATNKGIDALSGNPGGLALLNTAQFLGGSRITLLGQNSYETEYFERSDGTEYNGGLGIDPKILNLGVAVPISFEGYEYPLVGAIGYRSFYDWSSKNNETTERNDTKIEESTNTGGLINTLSFGIGTTIAEKYSFGVSFNIPLISGYTVENIYEDSDNKFESLEEFDVTGGSFIQFGGIVNVIPKLTIGVSYIFAHEFKLEKGERTSKINGETNSEVELSDIKFEMPGIYSFGIAYKVLPKLLVSAEIQNRSWGDLEINNDELPNSIESGSSYRFGFEYGTYVLYRFGYASERIAFADLDEDPVNISTLTGGIGLRMNNIIFDVGTGYKFTSFEARETGGRTYDFVKNKLNVYATATYAFDLRIGE